MVTTKQSRRLLKKAAVGLTEPELERILRSLYEIADIAISKPAESLVPNSEKGY